MHHYLAAAIALIGAYSAAVLAVVAGAVSIWQVRCEGFGCMGIGIELCGSTRLP